MHMRSRMFPVVLSSWILIILTVHLTAPITDASVNVPGAFEREIDNLAALAREQRSVEDLVPAEEKPLQPRSEGPRCFLESRPSEGVFKRVDALLEFADSAEGECQRHLFDLIEEQANGVDISKKATHQECLAKCSDSEASKKSCSMFLPKSDKYYHKLVVKSKTTGRKFGVCVRTTSFDAEDNYENGIFNSKKECKDACGFAERDTSVQKRSEVPSLNKRAGCELYPCQNGGSCINGTCVCPSGYDGASCENKKCNPACQNSGICKNGVCHCLQGYNGSSCENAICTTPCKNGGTCKDPTRNTCQCPSGFFGSICEYASCIPFCENGGKCARPNDCECTFEYSGPRCNASKCSHDPGNRGICKFNASTLQYETECAPGYSGDGCNVKSKCSMTVQPGYSRLIVDKILTTASQNINNLDWTGNKASTDTCIAFLNTLKDACNGTSLTLTQTICEANCVPAQTGNICNRMWNPSSYSYGSEYFVRKWYHDAATKSCKTFDFLGCYANENSFDSESSCLQGCIEPAVTTPPPPPTYHPTTPDEPGLCVAHGRAHFSTFDHTDYAFYGICSYLLLYINDPNINFQVILVNDPLCDINSKCKKTVKIDISGKVIELLPKVGNTHIVKINNQVVKLPYKQDLPSIREVGDHVIVQTSDNVFIYWDGYENVMIKLPDSYKSTAEQQKVAVKGLCGNYDGDQSNDLTGLDNKLYTKKTINDFGKSWLHDTLCTKEPSKPQTCFTLAGESYEDALNRAERICETINSAPFQPCHPKLGTKEFKYMCIADVCACNTTARSDCACNSLSMYSRACAWTHNTTLAWRSPSLCPASCPSGMVHNECGSACPLDCTNLNNDPSKCQSKCLDGCHCPPGKYFDAGKCVDQSMCSCHHSNIRYPHGAVRESECEKCTCNGGNWNCQKIPCKGTCSVLGDPHINTFDGKSYNMHGKCAYILSEHCHYSAAETKKFSIVLKTVNCQSGAACSRQLIINITGAPLITLGSTNSGVNFLPTITVENGNPKTYYSKLVDIEHVGPQTVQVHAAIGLMLTWTGYNAYLTVEPGLENQTCGLCGTFNHNAGDDFHKRDGDTEVTALAFSKEWMLPDSAQVDPNCHGTDWTNLDNPCNTYSSYRTYSNASCSHIKDPNGIFKNCHRYIPPNEYYQKCLGDGCKCKDCLCEVVSAYARACAEKNVIVNDWRNVITDCAAKFKCEADKVLKQCNKDPATNKPICPLTCNDLSNITQTCTSRGCVEACYCATPGHYLNNEHKCVPKTECPCYHNDKVYRYQEVRKDGCNNCTCVGGVFECTNVNCEAMCQAKGLVYSACGKTCKNLYEPSNCQAGCFCPPGLVMHENGTCLATDQCQCTHNSKFFDKGAVSPTDCSRRCNGMRIWEQTAGIPSQPEYECSSFGQGHVETFDGLLYNFDNTGCSYKMVDHADFGLVVKKKKCVNSFELQMCKEVTISLPKDNVEVVLMQKTFTIKRNNVPSTYNPGEYPPPCKPVMEGSFDSIEIFQVGLFLVVRIVDKMNPKLTKFEVRFDQGTRVYVTANPIYQNQLKGLCGNFDGSKSDERLSSTGFIANSVPEFVNSWKTGDDCENAKEIAPCDLYPDRSAWAQKGCSEIRNNPNFTICHDSVDPDEYIKACEYESCLCHEGGDCACFCSAVAAYVRACNRFGISITWRREGFCELPCCRPCKNTGGYIANNTLPHTCAPDPKDCSKVGDRCCRGARVEGCSCPNNTFFDGKKCAPLNETCELPCSSSSTTSTISSTTTISSSTVTSSVPTTSISSTTSTSTITTSLSSTITSSPTTTLSSSGVSSFSTPGTSTATSFPSTSSSTISSTPTTTVVTSSTSSMSSVWSYSTNTAFTSSSLLTTLTTPSSSTPTLTTSFGTSFPSTSSSTISSTPTTTVVTSSSSSMSSVWSYSTNTALTSSSLLTTIITPSSSTSIR